MRQKPSDAIVKRLQNKLNSLYAFDVLVVSRILKQSSRNARRYITKMRELGLIELKYCEGKRHFYRTNINGTKTISNSDNRVA